MLAQNVLSEAMDKKNIKQSEFAQQLGVNKSTVSTTLHRDNMGVDTFVRYMNEMGFSVMAGEMKGNKFVPEWELTPGNADKRSARNRKE